MPDTTDSTTPHSSKVSKAQERNLSLAVLSAKLRKNYTFFANLSEEEMIAFLRMCDRQNYKNGDIIFEEGERESCWYIVLAGRISIYRKGVILGHVSEGQCFGEVGLLKQDTPRSASARAAAETIMLSVPHDILRKKMPGLSYKVLEYIAHQLAEKLLKTDDLLETEISSAESIKPSGEGPPDKKAD